MKVIEFKSGGPWRKVDFVIPSLQTGNIIIEDKVDHCRQWKFDTANSSQEPRSRNVNPAEISHYTVSMYMFSYYRSLGTAEPPSIRNEANIQ